jgi:hypothetical protein
MILLFNFAVSRCIDCFSFGNYQQSREGVVKNGKKTLPHKLLNTSSPGIAKKTDHDLLPTSAEKGPTVIETTKYFVYRLVI